MSILVIDASVAAKWFTEEEYSQEALTLIEGEASLHAPDFFLLEMDNVVCKWTRRGMIAEGEANTVRATLRQVPIQKYPFHATQDSAYTIANQTGRSIYDSLYVALAVLLKCRMVTADRKLYDALANGPLKKHVAWVGDVK